jgi:hypothetical protein
VVLQMIDVAHFWTLPSRQQDEPNPDGSVTVGLDGAQWVMEGVKDGKYHVVDRWSPSCGEYKGMCMCLVIDLGRLRLLYEDVY